MRSGLRLPFCVRREGAEVTLHRALRSEHRWPELGTHDLVPPPGKSHDVSSLFSHLKNRSLNHLTIV